MDGLTPKQWEERARENGGKEKKLVLPVSAELFFEEKLNWLTIGKDFCKKNPLYYDRAGLWWSWNWSTDTYEMIDETDLLIMIDKATNKYNLKSSLKAEILEGMRRAARENNPIEPPQEWIQFGDTIYDYKTGETKKASPQYFFTNSIPWKPGETTETPVLDKLFKEWVGDKAEQLYEIIAYCTIRDYPLNRLFVLIGSGANGKSTYLQIVRKFVGERNVASANLDQLADNPFQTAKLYKKLLCVMGETNFERMKNTSRLKELTGKDLVSIEYKNKTPFDAVNYAKIIIATNSLPETHDKTDGFYRRWVIIDFKNQFEEARDILSEISDEEYSALANRCLITLQGLMNKRSFTNEGSIQERRERYENRSNPLTSFLKQYEADSDTIMPAGEFYDDFSVFLRSNGFRGLTYNVVRGMMKEAGYEYEKHRIPGRDNPVACVVGLKRSHNTKMGVPAVPVVPVVSIQPYPHESQVESAGTSGTSGTLRRENLSVSDSTVCGTPPIFGVSELDLQRFFISKPENNAFDLENMYGEDTVKGLINKGIIFERPFGTYRLLK